MVDRKQVPSDSFVMDAEEAMQKAKANMAAQRGATSVEVVFCTEAQVHMLRAVYERLGELIGDVRALQTEER